MEYKNAKLRSFTEITAETANKIQNDRISVCVYLTDDELRPFRDPIEIGENFFELTIINNFGDLRSILPFIDTTDLKGRLQWMHLRTYINGGKVF